MLNHVLIGSNDIERSKAFYDAVLAVLGAPPGRRDTNGTGHTRIFYIHDGSVFGITQPIDGQSATVANGATIGFKCQSPEQASRFYEVAVANGGTAIEEPPGIRPRAAGGPTYLAYVRDPDGTKLCAVCRSINK